MPDLLIELLSEEIPARMQPRACDDLHRLICDGLRGAGLTLADAAAFSTPRRLTLTVAGLAAESPARHEQRKGPRVDAPEQAIEGFLRSTGLTREDLRVKDDKKGQYYSATIKHPGRPAAEIVAEVLEHAIRNFPWPKSMRWGSGSLRWVRPLHGILCILSDESGAQIVPLSVDGITAGDTTRGHRFMAPAPFAVTGFEDYAARLKRAHVILDTQERAAHIHAEAESLAFAQGLELVEDAALLREVAGLVEWPVVLVGGIGRDYLDLPPEVLQTSMREHQKFFSLRNPKSGQIEKFITVANRDTADGGATILAGNQKVLAARLEDAKFFWGNDLRVVRDGGLEGMAAGLADVTFHAKLGSQAERVSRIAALAREIAPMVGADPDLAAQAARVAKADLQSEMVGEFPELQGVMGVYYARAQGLPEEVAAACKEHYQPLGPKDEVPSAPVSVAVALADKIDTLTGFWAIDEKPTGSKDPYALRRAALGVIRLLTHSGHRVLLRKTFLSELHKASNILQHIETANELSEKLKSFGQEIGKYNIELKEFKHLMSLPSRSDVTRRLVERNISNLEEIIQESWGVRVSLNKQLEYVHEMDATAEIISSDLLSFLHDRLKVHLREQGIRHDVIDACLYDHGSDEKRADSDDLTLLVRRVEALSDLLKTEDGGNLLQGFKRANNILTQAEEADGVEYSFGPDPKLAETAEEAALFKALDAAEAEIAPAMQAEDFATAMRAMARLRAPIDAFFEAVQINTENQTVRRNRLNLLHRIREICGGVADLSRLEG